MTQHDPTAMNSSVNPLLLRDLSSFEFDDLFVRSFPADSNLENRPRQVQGISYTPTLPTPVSQPRLLAWSERLGESLGIRRPDSTTNDSVVASLAGSALLNGMRPFSTRYGGHQFGNWAGQLGDGRAITLGEIIDPRGQRQELQLKGAGPTPYSRTADGRAVLRSSIREFLCSEAMFHLGVPTTRALSLVGTGDTVVRDMFYDGRPAAEPGAIVCRVAPTFVRFGHFEILAAQHESELLKQLVAWVMQHHYPKQKTIDDWFGDLCHRTASLVVDWMRFGFVHGVMNTDNMSILGLTIDYGPYGWLEGIDFSWTPNTTDAQGRRYCYGRQPQIALWNLNRLADALATLQSDHQGLQQGLNRFADEFNRAWPEALAKKIGFQTAEDAGELANELMALLQKEETDFTLFFRRLAQVSLQDCIAGDRGKVLAPLKDAFYSENGPSNDYEEALVTWLKRWAQQLRALGEADVERIARMNSVNPKYILRNYLAQQAIDLATQGDNSMIETLLTLIEHPFDEQPRFESFAVRRPEWARNKAGCSALSCSS